MQLTLYVDGYFVSQFDACCMIALEEKGLPYSTSRALLRDGGGVPAALASRTGISRVPALQHGDFWLTESMAIAEYIEDSFPPPAYTRLMPADPRARARARQIMAWVRIEMRALRNARPWWMTVYPALPPPLTPEAEQDARELVDFVIRLSANGDLAEWNIAHADLALALYRLARTEYPLPQPAQSFLDANLVRPSIRSYLDHPRPPNPPP